MILVWAESSTHWCWWFPFFPTQLRHTTVACRHPNKKNIFVIFLNFEINEKTFSFFSEMIYGYKISAKIHQNDYIKDDQRNFACKQLDVV